MRQKFISFCAEYFIYVGAFLVVVLVIQQENFYDSLILFGTIASTTILLWFFGAFLKYVIRKERPSVEKRLSKERDRYAFPSMHALTLASSATFISMHDVRLGVLAYIVVILVMYARVKTHMHYAIDMVAGFFLGAVLTYLCSPYIESYVTFLF